MTEIIAHRGASRDFRENTLPAFTAALEQGADGIELDVHSTRDGAIVVHHDAALRGNGADGRRSLSDMTATEVGAVRFPDGSGIPTLDEVLALVGVRATVYVEVKAARIEPELVECLRRHPTSRVAVHAFDHRIPVAVRALLPGVAIGFLSSSYPLNLSASLGDARPETLWQHTDVIDAALVRAAHSLGTRVAAWTENDPVHARELIAMGVDALCTDTPGALRARLSG